MIRNIDSVYPVFAKQFILAVDGLKFPGNVDIGSSQIQSNPERLYQAKDQLNAQLSDFVTARYQSYINAELDLNVSLRDKGREEWNRTLEKIQLAALKIREAAPELENNASKAESTKLKLSGLREKRNKAKQDVEKTKESYRAGYEVESKGKKFLKTPQEMEDKLAPEIHAVEVAIQEEEKIDKEIKEEEDKLSRVREPANILTELSTNISSILK